MLLAGDSYDGFLPYPARSITGKNISRERRRARRDAYGTPFRRLLTALMPLLCARRPQPSHLGLEFCEAISNFEITGQDAIIIPSATLDDLSAVVETYEHLDYDDHPQCYVRFLDPSLGEPSKRLREAQMAALLKELPQKVHLYCETDEMADIMSDRFHHQFGGSFYLPCTLDPREEWKKPQKSPEAPFRVGVFGIPRKEKGAARICAIINETIKIKNIGNIEFIIQGNEADFHRDGIYSELQKHIENNVVRKLLGLLSSDEFKRNILLADALILPYDLTFYRFQGSGLVQDAVAANIPIIYSNGMSMKNFLGQGNALTATSDEEFAKAIAVIAANNHTFVEGCRAANHEFRKILTNHPLRRL